MQGVQKLEQHSLSQTAISHAGAVGQHLFWQSAMQAWQQRWLAFVSAHDSIFGDLLSSS